IKTKKQKLEKEQLKTTKMIEEYKLLKYEDRLVQTGLTTLEERRTRGDLIEVFKMIKGLNKSDYTRFFTLAQNNRTRGHALKMIKNRSRVNVRSEERRVGKEGRYKMTRE